MINSDLEYLSSIQMYDGRDFSKEPFQVRRFDSFYDFEKEMSKSFPPSLSSVSSSSLRKSENSGCKYRGSCDFYIPANSISCDGKPKSNTCSLHNIKVPRKDSE